MGMDHVEAVVIEIQGIGVCDAETQVVRFVAAPVGRCGLDDLRGDVHADGNAGSHSACQVGGDVARAAADVEQSLRGAEFGQKVSRRVLGGTPSVAAKHRVCVSMCVAVGHLPSFPRALRNGSHDRKCSHPGSDTGSASPRSWWVRDAVNRVRSGSCTCRGCLQFWVRSALRFCNSALRSRTPCVCAS